MITMRWIGPCPSIQPSTTHTVWLETPLSMHTLFDDMHAAALLSRWVCGYPTSLWLTCACSALLTLQLLKPPPPPPRHTHSRIQQLLSSSAKLQPLSKLCSNSGQSPLSDLRPATSRCHVTPRHLEHTGVHFTLWV